MCRNLIINLSAVTHKVSSVLIEWFLFCLVFLDEDRLSRRKSIVDTVSIQVDILPGNNTEDKV